MTITIPLMKATTIPRAQRIFKMPGVIMDLKDKKSFIFSFRFGVIIQADHPPEEVMLQ